MSNNDLINFYTTIIRSQLEYAAPVFATSLPNYLIDRLELIQKSSLHYSEALKWQILTA